MNGASTQSPVSAELDVLANVLEEQANITQSLGARLGWVTVDEAPPLTARELVAETAGPDAVSPLRIRLSQLALTARANNDRLTSMLDRLEV